jgi:hypothetical protein
MAWRHAVCAPKGAHTIHTVPCHLMPFPNMHVCVCRVCSIRAYPNAIDATRNVAAYFVCMAACFGLGGDPLNRRRPLDRCVEGWPVLDIHRVVRELENAHGGVPGPSPRDRESEPRNRQSSDRGRLASDATVTCCILSSMPRAEISASSGCRSLDVSVMRRPFLPKQMSSRYGAWSSEAGVASPKNQSLTGTLLADRGAVAVFPPLSGDR